MLSSQFTSSFSSQSRFRDATSLVDNITQTYDRPSETNQSKMMRVEIEDESQPRSSHEDSVFPSAERPYRDISVVSLNAGPRLRKTSFTFEGVENQEHGRRAGTLMSKSESIASETAEKRRTRGSETQELAIEATHRPAHVSGRDGLPIPTPLRRRLSRPSTGSSTISRITNKSSSLVQDVIRPLGRLSRKKSSDQSPAPTETDTSGSFTTEPSENSGPRSPPLHHDSMYETKNQQRSRAHMPELAIFTGNERTYATSPVGYVAYPQDSPPEHIHRSFQRPLTSPSPAREMLDLSLYDRNEIPRPTENLGSARHDQDKLPSRSRIVRRDSAIREARMESMVHTLMGGGTRPSRDDTRQRQQSEDTVHPSMKRLRTTSETGAVRSRSETAWSRGTNSMMSLQEENKGLERVKRRRSRALSDIAATPPITPVIMKPERLFDLPDSNHRPSPLYTFPQPQKENRELEPLKVIKPKRSGFMSFLREKMLSRNIPDEPMGPDGLSESQRIRAAYLMTKETEKIRGEKRSNTMPNVKARPSRTVSQLITPTKDRHTKNRSASVRVRPTSMLIATPPRSAQRDSSTIDGDSLNLSGPPADHSEPVSLVAMKSRNFSLFQPEKERSQDGDYYDDKARIKQLEEELSATRKAWHTQITQLESQLGRLKDAMSLATQEAQASRIADRERHSGVTTAHEGICRNCLGLIKEGKTEKGQHGLQALVVKNP